MTENLLDADHATDSGASTAGDIHGLAPGQMDGTAKDGSRPDGLPDKFWDEEEGQVRTDALAKSYQELERKLGGLGGSNVPDDPSGYEIETDDQLVARDEAVDAVLHGAGFSQEQAQMVYDLAAERLMPMVADVAAQFEAQRQIEHLSRHFGGDEKWRETSRQLAQWGKANFPTEVYDALSTTHEGVITMHRMMVNGEPGLIPDGGVPGAGPTEDDVKALMRDPKYWREQDPSTVAKVRDGFRRLYPE